MKTQMTKNNTEQDLMNKSFIKAICLAGIEHGITQIWQKNTDSSMKITSYMSPVCFFDEITMDSVLEKISRYTYLKNSKEKYHEIYFTINSYLPWKKDHLCNIRTVERCKNICTVYCDIDMHSGTDFSMLSRLREKLILLCDTGKLPDCGITFSGRGFGIFLSIAPLNPQNHYELRRYQRVCSAVAEFFRTVCFEYPGVDVDASVVGDLSRIARLPGTLNVAARTMCCAIRVPKHRYLIDELEAFFHLEKPQPAAPTQLPRTAILYQGNELSRLEAYLADNPVQRGMRNIFLYTAAEICLRDEKVLSPVMQQHLTEINHQLEEPLGESELHQIWNKAEKAAAAGKLPRSETIAKRLNLSEVQKKKYGFGIGYHGLHPLEGERISIAVEPIEKELLRISRLEGSRKYTELSKIQPLLSEDIRTSLTPETLSGLKSAEIKQRGRYFIINPDARKEHIQNYTRNRQREERKKLQDEKKEKAQQLLEQGLSVRRVSAASGLSASTVQRLKASIH